MPAASAQNFAQMIAMQRAQQMYAQQQQPMPAMNQPGGYQQAPGGYVPPPGSAANFPGQQGAYSQGPQTLRDLMSMHPLFGGGAGAPTGLIGGALNNLRNQMGGIPLGLLGRRY